MMSLPVWLPAPIFWVSVSGGGFYVHEGCLCPGGLCLGVSVRETPYGEEQAVCILVECILVALLICIEITYNLQEILLL